MDALEESHDIALITVVPAPDEVDKYPSYDAANQEEEAMANKATENVADTLNDAVAFSIGENYGEIQNYCTRSAGIALWGAISKLDDVNNVFVVDFMVFCVWKDNSLKVQGAPNKVITVNPAKMAWTPSVHPMNANKFENEIFDVFVNPKLGEAFCFYNWICELREPLELRRFPFDRQRLSLGVRGVNCFFTEFKNEGKLPHGFPSSRQLVDGARVTSSLTNFKLSGVEGISFRGSENGGMAFMACKIERRPQYYMWNVVFVLFLLVLVSSFSSQLPITDPSGRQGVSATFVLAGIAYKYVISQMLPPISYTTRLDWYVLFALFMLALNMVESLAITLLARLDTDNTDLMQQIDTIYFIGYVGVWLILHVLFMLSAACGCCRLGWHHVYMEDNMHVESH